MPYQGGDPDGLRQLRHELQLAGAGMAASRAALAKAGKAAAVAAGVVAAVVVAVASSVTSGGIGAA